MPMNDRTAHASMLIRRPAGEVFGAFVNPLTLRKFWLNDASGPLAPGARVRWEFMVPGAVEKVVVTRFEAPRLLGFDWSDGIHVDMTFDPFEDGTRVGVTVSGFTRDGLLAQATGAIEGFAIVLCDLKTLLETGESAHLVRDKAALITKTRAEASG
jgi:uncharacterized protein YndB with AHSA1/START domain